MDTPSERNFIEAISGIKPPQGLVAAVHTQTEGNPLFVTEVVRLLAQEGQLASSSERDSSDPTQSVEQDRWIVRIPEGVREIIGRRLNRLSERCNETLTVASVIGLEFTLEQIGPLIDEMTQDRLVVIPEEALASCRKAKYCPGLAWTCCDYADFLLDRNQQDDREEAMRLLDGTLQTSSDLGMRPLTKRALSRREILKA